MKNWINRCETASKKGLKPAIIKVSRNEIYINYAILFNETKLLKFSKQNYNMFPKPLELGLKKMGNVKCQQSNFCSINFVNILKKSACMECLFITSYDIHLFRAGTSLNGFLSKSLVYCEKMSE